MTRVGLDYETFSSVNLPERGLDNYVKSPDFRVLIASMEFNGVAWTYDWVFDCLWQFNGQKQTPMPHDKITKQFMGYMNRTDQIAHNAPFERAVTKWLDPEYSPYRIEDSAVLARAAGAESKLEVASRQLTNSDKLEVGSSLVMRFCVPNDLYPEGATRERIIENDDMDNWMLFIEYCEMDARGCREIGDTFDKIFGELDPTLRERELYKERATFDMNENGWHVDLPLVKKMKQRKWANDIIAKRAFVNESNQQINFNSVPQLKKYCAERGFPIKSTDKYHLPVYLEKVTEQLKNEDNSLSEDRLQKLREVQSLLEVKAELGGSMLTKLPVILNLVNEEDGRLRDQYMHLGAGQTFRTTGRGVQMQNLAKLKMEKDENGKEVPRDVSTLYDLTADWSNTDMAGNLRQVFTATHPEGQIIVGDFSAVESRGLAYLAGEEWKLDAYREGLDVYKVLVTKYDGIEYDEVTPALRPRGKYSELSCGYQASGAAVQEFMFRLGFSVSIEEALQNVIDWRGANPNIVDFWFTLDKVLKGAVRTKQPLSAKIGHGLTFKVTPFLLDSIQEIHPGAQSVVMQILLPDGEPFVSRVVHGCYFKKAGERVALCYYKPVDKLSKGKLWTPTYKHPKTKKTTFYSIYGGKVAGIMTQSFCREMFFESLSELNERLKGVGNALIVNQFHDEIGVDWSPEGPLSLEATVKIVEETMSHTRIKDFPLIADVKYHYRYVK